MENRIKEQLSLFADRMSAETLRPNQPTGLRFLPGCSTNLPSPQGRPVAVAARPAPPLLRLVSFPAPPPSPCHKSRRLPPDFPFQHLTAGLVEPRGFSHRLCGQIAQGDTLLPGPTQSQSFIARQKHLTQPAILKREEARDRHHARRTRKKTKRSQFLVPNL